MHCSGAGGREQCSPLQLQTAETPVCSKVNVCTAFGWLAGGELLRSFLRIARRQRRHLSTYVTCAVWRTVAPTSPAQLMVGRLVGGLVGWFEGWSVGWAAERGEGSGWLDCTGI